MQSLLEEAFADIENQYIGLITQQCRTYQRGSAKFISSTVKPRLQTDQLDFIAHIHNLLHAKELVRNSRGPTVSELKPSVMHKHVLDSKS